MASSLNVAIIGGGIIGLQTALGLIKRNISVAVFEQARELREIGAGLGFVTNIIECMDHLDPRIASTLHKIGIKTEDPLRWVNMFNPEDVRKRPVDQFFDMELPTPGHDIVVCRRADFLEELIGLLPEGCLKLGKRLEKLEQMESTESVELVFSDGTTELFDAVIGCDGIKSKVRCEVLPPNDPAAVAHFAHESAYRCLVDMDKALSALGNATKTPVIWTGPSAHVVTYPISDHKYLNVAVFLRQSEWTHGDQQVIRGHKKDIVEAFSTFGPAIRALADVLPEEQSRWAMFDSLDHPLSSYAYGTIALAGDAAHCSTPHHGMGAGMGVEDAVVLVSVLEQAQAILHANDTVKKSHAIGKALVAYDQARRERSQWLVASSRRQGQLYKWEVEPVLSDKRKLVDDSRDRVFRIYEFNWGKMVSDAVGSFQAGF